MEKFEALVVGAGTAGCMAARTLASAGLKVCLIDRKDEASIGEKVCGDAIGKHHFDNLGLAYPRGEELEGDIVGVKIYSPDLKTVFRIVGEGLAGFMVNRYLFGQRLLRNAIDAGAFLLDSTHISDPIVEDGFVRGVMSKNLRGGSKTELRAKVTVDASGFSAIIRSKLPPEIGIEQTISGKDYAVLYREIRKLREELKEPEFMEIYLDLDAAPGGYYWVFPRKDATVNVGLGVAAVEGFPNPKTQLYRHVLSSPLFMDSMAIHGGGGTDPTRRPLDSLVGNGIVVIGDAACQVNPIDGGGIGPSMMCGKIAGEVITKALGEDEATRENLWPINVRYIRGYGSKQAGLDVFRIFLQALTNDDLNYGMRYKLIKEEDVLGASLGEDIRLNITDATRRVFRGLGRLVLLKRLYRMAKTAKRVKTLYRRYPDSPDGIVDWKAKVQQLFEEAERTT